MIQLWHLLTNSLFQINKQNIFVIYISQFQAEFGFSNALCRIGPGFAFEYFHLQYMRRQIYLN